ncbi:unnamed protein product [Phyllotreta striolata]|uniref:Carboxylic ester hydrolase n=1 Tax=Phyllotreta striolata TaxID=444603 RepID=A0A9N9TN91_PHYSR|nr:unnamed protein product [Phyllotreta striolata]
MYLPAILLIVAATLADSQRVIIPNGVIQGRVEYSLRGYSFNSFQQIPYAQPPIGPLRFQPPLPAKKWKGILNATVNDKVCYQMNNLLQLPPNNPFESEDCLYLNVYTPAGTKLGDKLPVMVYIHGGGFEVGTGNFIYLGPHYWMEHGVVVITLNYRLGPFGFLSTGDTVLPGNYGLKDQLMALKWVRTNVAYFGGDPDKVTIFGQSAGASSVAYLLMTEKSKGLFRAAIAQSGTILSPWAYQRHHTEYAYELGSFLDPAFTTENTTQELMEYLQSVPPKELNEAAIERFPEHWEVDPKLQTPFAPSIEPDHPGAFITGRMYEAIAGGKMQRRPLMMGTCSEDYMYAVALDVNRFLNEGTKTFDDNLLLLYNENMHLTDEKKQLAAARAIKRIYTNESFYEHPGKLIQFRSDEGFGLPGWKHAKMQSEFSDVFYYQFSYMGSIPPPRPNIPESNRVGHGDENYYMWVFNNNSNLNDYPQSDIITSERLRTLFTNFAKYLDPTFDRKDVLGVNSWEKVEPCTFNYLNINETLKVQTNLKQDIFEDWEKVYDKFAVEPLDTY